MIIINSVWLNDTIWQHRSGSTLAQVKACYQKMQSNYLNQCWLILHVYFQFRDQLHRKFARSLHKMSLKNTLIKCTSSFRGQSFDAIWFCNNMVLFFRNTHNIHLVPIGVSYRNLTMFWWHCSVVSGFVVSKTTEMINDQLVGQVEC